MPCSMDSDAAPMTGTSPTLWPNKTFALDGVQYGRCRSVKLPLLDVASHGSLPKIPQKRNCVPEARASEPQRNFPTFGGPLVLGATKQVAFRLTSASDAGVWCREAHVHLCIHALQWASPCVDLCDSDGLLAAVQIRFRGRTVSMQLILFRSKLIQVADWAMGTARTWH